MISDAASVAPGQSVYRPLLLRFYDLVVYVYNSPFLWRCPPFVLRQQYERHLGRRHLEVGVGTGYLIDTAHLTIHPEVTLLDINRSCLTATGRRLARFAPQIVQASALEPLPDLEPFDSIAMNYVVHCLPGSIEEKGAAFGHVAARLADDGVFFGATILQGSAPRSPIAQLWMDFYNRRGVFHNAKDTPRGLRAALERHFGDVRVELRGCVGVWTAKRPIRS